MHLLRKHFLDKNDKWKKCISINFKHYFKIL